MEDKYCPGCRHSWPLVCFWKDRSRVSGLHVYCKNCLSVRHSAYWKLVYYPKHSKRLSALNNARQKEKRRFVRISAFSEQGENIDKR